MQKTPVQREGDGGPTPDDNAASGSGDVVLAPAVGIYVVLQPFCRKLQKWRYSVGRAAEVGKGEKP